MKKWMRSYRGSISEERKVIALDRRMRAEIERFEGEV